MKPQSFYEKIFALHDSTDKEDGAETKSESIICQFLSSFKEKNTYDILQQTITQKIPNYELYDFYIVFAMSPWGL